MKKSSYCVIPEKWRTFADIIDTNNDGKISQDELNKAMEILEKANKQDKRIESLRMLNTYTSNL